MTQHTSLGLSVIAPTAFGDDSTYAPNSFVTGLTSRAQATGGRILTPTLNDLSYGVKDGKAWLLASGEMLGEGGLPQWCACRSRGEVLFHIAEMGIPCFPTPANIEFFYSKRTTAAFAAKLGLPVANTASGPDGSRACDLKYPMIVKPSQGNKGSNVRKVHDGVTRRAAEHCVNQGEPGGVIWQEALPTGDDLRLYMLGTEPYCAVLRRARGMKANLGENPVQEVYPTSKEVLAAFPNACDIAVTAFENAPFGEMGLGSADFLFREGGGDADVVLGEVTCGNIGTALLNKHIPRYVDDYVDYIESRVFG